MLGSYSANPVSYPHARRICEALAEGAVLAMMAEFEAMPPGYFPCCVKCGGYEIEGSPLCPAACVPLADLFGQFGRFVYSDDIYEHQNIVPGYTQHPPTSLQRMPGPPPAFETLRFRSPHEILRTGRATTLELACYQCALKRLRGNDPGCKVVVFEVEPGTFRGAVLHSDQHENPERWGTIDDPVTDAVLPGLCGCGGHGGEHHHHDDDDDEPEDDEA